MVKEFTIDEIETNIETAKKYIATTIKRTNNNPSADDMDYINSTLRQIAQWEKAIEHMKKYNITAMGNINRF